jgi:hypothetical protein
MNVRRWLNVILMMGLILALGSLGAQADPYGPYHHPRGHAYGWDGPGQHHGHYKHFRRSCRGPYRSHCVERVYTGPPAVAYVAPAAPVMGIPYAAPQPYYSQPYQSGPPGFHGQFNYNF